MRKVSGSSNGNHFYPCVYILVFGASVRVRIKPKMVEDRNDDLLFNLSSEPVKKQEKKTPEERNENDKTNVQPSLPSSVEKKALKKKKKEMMQHAPGKGPKDFHAHKSKEHVPSSSLFTGSGMTLPLIVKKQKSISEPLFSAKTFDFFDLHPHLVACLKSRLEAEKATKVQEQTIPVLLDGHDALVKSCTGSGQSTAAASSRLLLVGGFLKESL
ncbi:hypothetical protein AVEN_199907-1 [Araneus ventricosus]|uniref:Uncharacterized protein n=1 Tax=Araneus ventricosus TaxID=182803 RepID=A0A4Y2QZZ6_ARAVE|nr:hypothetical protein AVEN_199907-1 [Araneus ventricosus]